MISQVNEPKPLNQVQNKLRFKHYSLRMEEAYVNWIKRLILFHGKRHPRERGTPHVELFLTSLAVGRNVAAPVENQTLPAILCFILTSSTVAVREWKARSTAYDLI